MTSQPAIKTLLAGAALALAFTTLGRAENWPQFRGPTGVGISAEKDLPLKWDGKTGEGVLWKVELKGTNGHSSPIAWEDRVFVTTSDRPTAEQEKNKEVPDHHLRCYATKNGDLLWTTRIAPGKQFAGSDTYATPTPVTDGKAVYCWFGSAVIAAVDFEGNLLWRHERPGPFHVNPGICSSPIVYQDTVILLSDQGRDNGFLQGLDRKTGEIKWQQPRKGVGACNATPILIDVQGKQQLIIAGSSRLDGLDPTSGESIWSCKSSAFGASPAYGKSLLYVGKGQNEPAQAVDPSGKGDVTETHVKWELDKLAGDYSSPVVIGDYVYRVQAEGILNCLELATGDKVYTERLEGLSRITSPVATADGRVYFISTGHSHVIRAGPKFELLASNKLPGGGNGASPAISNGRIYVRDHGFLYCLGMRDEG